VSLDLEAIPVAGEGARRLTEDQGSNPLLQRLRERYERAEEDSTLDLDIPEYGGLLVARFRRLKGDELDGLTADVENLLEYNIAVLVEATVEVLARDKDGTLQSLADDHPVLWDAELAGILGFEAESAREVLLKAFHGRDLIVRNFGDQVSLWMVNGRNEPDLGK
jgi:hypothetical protein